MGTSSWHLAEEVISALPQTCGQFLSGQQVAPCPQAPQAAGRRGSAAPAPALRPPGLRAAQGAGSAGLPGGTARGCGATSTPNRARLALNPAARDSGRGRGGYPSRLPGGEAPGAGAMLRSTFSSAERAKRRLQGESRLWRGKRCPGVAFWLHSSLFEPAEAPEPWARIAGQPAQGRSRAARPDLAHPPLARLLQKRICSHAPGQHPRTACWVTTHQEV